MLRRLSEGKAVGVYPEGERSWDAELQPFRRGTLRVLMKAGVPIIPCGLAGPYDVWPRWSKIIRRLRIRVEFGEAIRWPAMDDREERNAFLPEANRQLRERLAELSAWKHLNDASGRPVKRPSEDQLPSWLNDHA